MEHEHEIARPEIARPEIRGDLLLLGGVMAIKTLSVDLGLITQRRSSDHFEGIFLSLSRSAAMTGQIKYWMSRVGCLWNSACDRPIFLFPF